MCLRDRDSITLYVGSYLSEIGDTFGRLCLLYTSRCVSETAYTVAAKTGSAEFETGKETHAWFTGFAPAEAPRLVVTVLVEELQSD